MAKTTPKTADGRELAVRNVAEQMPAHLRDHDGQGSTDLLKQYVVPPRIKIVQGQAKKPFNELFRPGDLCAVPMMRGVWEGGQFRPGEPNVAFHFVPVMFYPEWVSWNPYGTDLQAVRARSFDPRGEIAVKSRDPERRKEKCLERPTDKDGKQLFVSHLEHLNYLIMILPPNQMEELPVVLTFASGEHRAGTSFNTLVQSRRTKALYGCQFAARVCQRENKLGTWYGIEVDNPAEDSGVTPYVMDQERFEALGRIHSEYKGYLADKLIQTQYDDEDTVEGAAASPKTEERF
jgi:hypothetical protein